MGYTTVYEEKKDLFVLGFVPEKNITKIVYDMRTEAFGLGDTPDLLGMPAAVLLGFFENKEGDFKVPKRQAFVSQCATLFDAIPEKLLFARLEARAGYQLLVPEPQISDRAFEVAKILAESWGLSRVSSLDYPSAWLGGFFVGKAVTPTVPMAFSFYHFAIVLYEIETRQDSAAVSIHWTECARAPRKVHKND
ncbi:MAG TPA: hypothetical protein PLT87_07900 [Spirochaetales bacterium]|nr:hypothetical protein [Spirochaetales bacterium]